jgi:predicted amidophosphoribosyltransferase
MLVENCPKCGRVYQKNNKNMCQSCSNRLVKELMDCKEFMWQNPTTTTEELSEATNVNISTIYQMIKDGLFAKNYASLTYPCESCAEPIRKNRLCAPCLEKMKTLSKQLTQPFF